MDAIKRVRGRALQALRSRLLRENPLCVMCKAAGRITPATELDHVIALSNGGSNDEDNMQGLCSACHEIKTLNDLGRRQRMDISADGWPVPAMQSGPRWRRAG